MIIDELKAQPELGLNYLQRYVNDLSPSGYHKTAPEPYNPQGTCPSFALHALALERNHKHLVVFDADPPDYLYRYAISGDHLYLPIHPIMERKHFDIQHDTINLEISKFCNGTPTASARTVSTLDFEHNFFIKLHYDEPLGRWTRKITKDIARWGKDVSAELDFHASHKHVPDYIGYLAEPLAVVLDKPLDIGCVFREKCPRPYIDEPRFLIPCHALFAKDLFHPNHPDLLFQLFSHYSPDIRTEKFITEMAMLMVDAVCWMMFNLGLAPEAHAQNTYIEIDQTLRCRRLIFQDFEAFLYDEEIRHDAGLHCKADRQYRKYLSSNDQNRHIERSYYFDMKFSSYLIEPLLHAFAQDFSLDFEPILATLRERIKNSQWNALLTNYLPTQGYRQVATNKVDVRKMEVFTSLLR